MNTLANKLLKMTIRQWFIRRPAIDVNEACSLRTRKERDFGETEVFSEKALQIEKDLASLVEQRICRTDETFSSS